MQATAAPALVVVSLIAMAGCAAAERMIGSTGRIVVERGHSADGHRWQLAASEQNGHLGLFLENPPGPDYSGAVGFAAGPAAGFWMIGAGPDGADFYYGPTPAAAVTVQLSAPGRATILLPTRPFPSGSGLPRGRFFIIRPPGPSSVNWRLSLLDRAGHKVAFADF